jgi:multidrug efflux pump subunit AcrB
MKMSQFGSVVLAFTLLSFPSIGALPQPKGGEDATIIYVVQPLRGVDPAQMKSLIGNYYEYHFRFIKGVRSVDTTLTPKGTATHVHCEADADLAKVCTELTTDIDRARRFLPSGTASPLVTFLVEIPGPGLSFRLPIPIWKERP